MKEKSFKALKIIGNIFITLLIVLTAFITILSLATKKDGIPNINGYIMFSIQTESMEPTINEGDLIITKAYDSTEHNYDEGDILKEGEVISFFAIEQEKKIIKTHRIISYDSVTQTYKTKGDNNQYEDEISVPPGDIISIWEEEGSFTKLPYLGTVKDLFGSKYGFLILIILPLFIFFLYQLYSFITLIIDVKKEQLVRDVKEEVKPNVEAASQVHVDEIAALKAKLEALEKNKSVSNEQSVQEIKQETDTTPEAEK